MKSKVVAIAVGASWVCTLGVAYFVGRESIRNELRDEFQKAFAPPSASTTTTQPEPEDISKYEHVEVSPEQLVRKFADNKAAAEDWANRKVLVFRAPIESIENDTLGRTIIYVTFEAKFGGVINPSVRVAFDGSFREDIHRLRKGEQVTCGSVYQSTGLGTDLDLIGVDIHKEK